MSLVRRIYSNVLGFPSFFKFTIIITTFFLFLVASDISFLRGPAPYHPEWQWSYSYVSTWSKIWAPLSIFAAILCFAYYFEKKLDFLNRNRTTLLLLVLVLLGILYNLSITYFSRAGIGVLVARVIDKDNNGYFTTANGITNVSYFLKTYEAKVLSFYQHAQGHPPGAILLHKTITDVSEFILGGKNTFLIPTPKTERVKNIWNNLSPPQQLSSIISIFVTLLLSNLTAIFIFFVGKHLKSAAVGLRSAIATILIPASSFFYPFPDVYFPIFGVLTFLFLLRGLKTQSSKLICLSAIFFSIGLFFSFSLLPLGLFFFLQIAISGFYKNKFKFNLIFMPLAVIIGTIYFLYTALFLLTSFNILSVFSTILKGLPEHRSYLIWLLYNPYDFFIFTGLPVSSIFIYSLVKLAKLFANSKKPLTILSKNKELFSFSLMLIILIISGSVRGEVGRIWLPLMPFVTLFTVIYISNRYSKKSFKLYVTLLSLIFAQTIILQEFWVMLW